MLSILARDWWAMALQGLLTVIFGILAMVWPQQTLLVLVYLFAAYALVDGVFTLIEAVAWHELLQRWWAVALGGTAGIAVGIVTFIWPNMTGLVLLYLIAAWAIVTGVLEIVAAIELRRVVEGEWLMVVSGVLSVIFGVLLVAFPRAGALGLAWLIGAYGLISGILLIVLAFHLRRWRQHVDKVMRRTFEGLAR